MASTFILVIWLFNGTIDRDGKFDSIDECIDWGIWKVGVLNKYPDKQVQSWRCQEVRQ